MKTPKASNRKKSTITKPAMSTTGLNLSERGLLSYMLGRVSPDGNFQQKQSVTAYDNQSTRPTIHRIEKDLIRKGAVQVVFGSVKDPATGHNIPAILKPLTIVPQVQLQQSESKSTNGTSQVHLLTTPEIQENASQSIDSKEAPSPNGHLEALCSTERKNSTVYRECVDSVRVVKCPPVDLAPTNTPAPVRHIQPPDIAPDPVVQRLRESGAKYMGGATPADIPTEVRETQVAPEVALLRASGAKYMGVPPKPSQSDIRQQIAELQEKLAHYIAADQRSAIAGFPNAWTRYVEETWAEIARLEKEQYGHVQTKRELNAKNPLLYDDNGGYKYGQSYPDADGDGKDLFDENLVPECSVCRVEHCWVTSEDERFTIEHTCGNPACEATRAKVLEGQKEFDERVSEDETLTTREEGVV